MIVIPSSEQDTCGTGKGDKSLRQIKPPFRAPYPSRWLRLPGWILDKSGPGRRGFSKRCIKAAPGSMAFAPDQGAGL